MKSGLLVAAKAKRGRAGYFVVTHPSFRPTITAEALRQRVVLRTDEMLVDPDRGRRGPAGCQT